MLWIQIRPFDFVQKIDVKKSIKRLKNKQWQYCGAAPFIAALAPGLPISAAQAPTPAKSNQINQQN